MRTRSGRGSNQYQTQGTAVDRTRADTAAVVSGLAQNGGGDGKREPIGRRELAARVAAALSSVRQPPTAVPLISDDRVEMYAALAAHITDLVLASDIEIRSEATDEEDVAFAFSNPDAAAAGFTRHTAWQGDAVWDGDFSQARIASELGGSWFDANRQNGTVLGVTSAEWYQEGFWQPSLVQTWSEAGFTPGEAVDWMTRSFDHSDAAFWRDAAFAPEDAFEWRQACLEVKKRPHPETIMGWRGAGFEPAEVVGCINAKVSLSRAVEARDEGKPPSSVAELGPAGIPGRSWKNTVAQVEAGGLLLGEFTATADGWTVTVAHLDDDAPVVQVVFDSGGRFLRAEVPRDRWSGAYRPQSVRSAKDIKWLVGDARRERDAPRRR